MFSDAGSDEINDVIDSSYTSRVAEIFNVVLKSLGITLDFLDDDEEVRVLNDDDVTQHELNGQTYFCTDYQFFLMERIEEIKQEIFANTPILTEKQLQERIEEELKNKKYINGPLNEELGDLDLRVSEEIERIAKELSEEVNSEKESEETKAESTEEVTDNK